MFLTLSNVSNCSVLCFNTFSYLQNVQLTNSAFYLSATTLLSLAALMDFPVTSICSVN